MPKFIRVTQDLVVQRNTELVEAVDEYAARDGDYQYIATIDGDDVEVRDSHLLEVRPYNG